MWRGFCLNMQTSRPLPGIEGVLVAKQARSWSLWRLAEAAALCLVAFVASAQGRPSVVLAVSPTTGSDAAGTRLLSEFKAKLGSSADVTPASTAQAAGVLEDLQRGKIDVAVIPLSTVARVIPGFRIYDMSFAFPDVQAMLDFATIGLGADLLGGELKNQGLAQLGPTWYGGSYQVGSKKPIRSPKEILGQKLIVRSNDATKSQFESAGAKTVQAPFAEVYQALQSGVADSVELRWEELPNYKGAFPFVTESNHRYAGLVALYNEQSFGAASPETQNQIRRAINEAARQYSSTALARERDIKRNYVEGGVFAALTFSPEIRAQWEASTKVEQQAQRQDVNPRLVTAAKNVPVPSPAPPPDSFPPRATWNSWFEDGDVRPPALVVGKAYRLVLDLGKLGYPGAVSGAASDKIQAATAAKGSTTFVVKPLVLGQAIKSVDDKPISAQILTVDGARAPHTQADEAAVSQFTSSGKNLRDLARQLSLARPLEWDVVAKDTGCARVVFSIWNAAGNRPLDYLAISFPVAAENQATPQCDQYARGGQLSAGLVGFLGDFANAKTTFDAALHFFDVDDNGPSTVAVYLRRSEAEAAAREGKPVPLLAWQLDDHLAGLLSKDVALPAAITTAHSKITSSRPYEDVVGPMSRVIFSGRRSEDKDIAAQVRASLQSLSNEIDAPLILTRYFSQNGEMRYVPLALLAAASSTQVLSRRVRVVQNLAMAEEPKPKACFAGWDFAIPKRLDSVNGDMANLLLSTTWRMAGPNINWIDDNKKLLEFVSTNPVKQADKGSALVLLAHHKDGKITYSSTASPDQILDSDISRSFGDGSIAILAACTTTGAATSSQAVINKLSRKNVSAFVVSPFQVDTTFGTRFATSFVAEADAARRSGATPSVAELFDGAVKRTLKLFGDRPGYQDMALELQILGDQDLRMCAP